MRGVPGFYGERLRYAREAMGLSPKSLASILNVSKQAISQYEKGADNPSAPVFDQIRSVLRHESHYFLRAPYAARKGTRFYRSMASATKTARRRAEAKQFWTRELAAYLSEYVTLPDVNLSSVSKNPHLLAMDEIESIASEMRLGWGLGDYPVPNLVEVAESHGVIVARHELESASLDALSEWMQPENRPFVILNTEKNISVRSRLDLGHELAHMVLHRDISPEQLLDDEVFDLIEAQAFRFGAALLLPEKPFLEDLYSVSLDALRSLKLKWKVSIAMMIERLKDLNIVSLDQHRKLRIGYSTRKWTRTEPLDDEIPIEEPTLFAKSVDLMAARGIRSIDQIASDTGFSVEWIEKLLAIKPQGGGPNVTPKILEFKRA